MYKWIYEYKRKTEITILDETTEIVLNYLEESDVN